MPRFYLDLRGHREAHAKGQTPWTPALAVVYQVDEGLALMAREGAAAIFARHEACAAAARAGLSALGFELFADPRFASRTVTAVKVPDGLDWKAFNTALKARGLVLAGGQGKLTGLIFRLGHLGSVTLGEILDAISVIEAVSIEQGRPVEAGARAGRRLSGLPSRRAGPWPPSEREDPRRRTGRRGGRRAPSGAPRGRRAGRSEPRRIRRLAARLRRARGAQPGPGRRRADRRRPPPGGHRAGRRRRRQRRPRRGDAGRHRRRQRADRQHHRRRRAHPGPAVRRRPAGGDGRRLGPARRVDADPVHRGRAARPDPGHRRAWARSARRSPTGPGRWR